MARRFLSSAARSRRILKPAGSDQLRLLAEARAPDDIFEESGFADAALNLAGDFIGRL